jgi:hypothetical protein
MIAVDLALKAPSARPIHEDLTATIGRYAVAYGSVARYLREAHLLPSSQDALPPTVSELSMMPTRLCRPLLTRTHLHLCGSPVE